MIELVAEGKKGASLQLPSRGPKTCIKVKCKHQRKTEGRPETGIASPSELVLAAVLTALRAAFSGKPSAVPGSKGFCF